MVFNIIHNNNNVIEYLYIAMFFKMFGNSVYNSIDGIKPSLETLKNTTEPDQIVNIVITDNISDAYVSFNLSKDTKYIFVSSYNSTGNNTDDIIDFPSDVNDVDDCKNLFKKIYMQCINYGFFNKNIIDFDVLNKMILMYIDCNMLSNYYVPVYLFKEEEKLKEYILVLKEKCEKYRNEIYKDNKDEITFASIYLHYIVNCMCTSFGFFPFYDWDLIIEFISVLSKIPTVSFQETSLLSALILDESKRSVNLMIDLYNKSMNKFAYFTMYHLAKVCKIQLRNITKAQDYLKLSISSNSAYYKSIYTLGLYSESKYNDENALKFYQDTVNVLSRSISKNCWQADEMACYIKACARIIKIGHRVRSKDIQDKYLSKIRDVAQIAKIKDNKFVSDLCRFLSYEDLKEDIYIRLVKNVNEHLKKFCDYNVYTKNKIIYTAK